MFWLVGCFKQFLLSQEWSFFLCEFIKNHQISKIQVSLTIKKKTQNIFPHLALTVFRSSGLIVSVCVLFSCYLLIW